MSIYHYLLGPAGMDETMVKQMNAAMKAVVEDPTVNAGIASIGNIPGWHDLEESKEIHDGEYAQFVQIAKDLDMFVQE
jgi:tripartite-type tricarboxylate transporter receptor subunit TctC